MAEIRFLDAIVSGRPVDDPVGPDTPSDDDALDAYSSVVTRVAELLAPSSSIRRCTPPEA